MTYKYMYSDDKRDDDNRHIKVPCKCNNHNHILKSSSFGCRNKCFVFRGGRKHSAPSVGMVLHSVKSGSRVVGVVGVVGLAVEQWVPFSDDDCFQDGQFAMVPLVLQYGEVVNEICSSDLTLIVFDSVVVVWPR